MVLSAVLCALAFATGWNVRPIPVASRMKELSDSLALLRGDVRTLYNRELDNAITRQHLEKILRDTLAFVAKSHKHDSVIIRKYNDLLTRKRTPHEVELEMLDLYTRLHPQH